MKNAVILQHQNKHTILITDNYQKNGRKKINRSITVFRD